MAFVRNLLGAKPRCHIRFDGDDGDDQPQAAEVAGGAAGAEATNDTEAGGAAVGYSSGLNACQRSVVAALGASQNGVVCPDLILLQGPPGTGKTTTLVQVRELLCDACTMYPNAPCDARCDALCNALCDALCDVPRRPCRCCVRW